MNHNTKMSLLQKIPVDIENIIFMYKKEFEACQERQDEAIAAWLVLEKQTNTVIAFLNEHPVCHPIQTILIELAQNMRYQGKVALTAQLCCGDVVGQGVTGLLEHFNQSVLSEIYLAHLENNYEPPDELYQVLHGF